MTNFRVVRSGPRENSGDYSYEEIEFQRLPNRENENGIVSRLVSNAVIHALEALLMALLSPIIMWRWLSKHDHFMKILKVIFEVALELIMLIVFAGVSILTAAALIFDDAYNRASIEKEAGLRSHNDDKAEKASEPAAIKRRNTYSMGISRMNTVFPEK